MSGISNPYNTQIPAITSYGKSVKASGASGASYTRNPEQTTDSTTLSMTDFYTLLAAQLKYQDADNPMDTSQMMAQMVQTQMIDAITNMSSAVNQMSTMNLTTYASSMVGKEVTMAEVDEDGKYTGKDTKGVVTGVLLGSDPILYIGDKEYHLSQLMSVGSVPKKEDGSTDK